MLPQAYDIISSMPQPPLVSIVVPCFNEEATIRLLLEALMRQTYPRERMEVVLADGMSTDRTRQVIAQFQAENPSLALRLVENPRRIIPAGVNRAIAEAHGAVIVRVDAHAVPYPEYVAQSVADLEAQQGEIVGGVWEIRSRGRGWMARSIAAAAASPLGVGDSFYRFTRQARYVDTVPFGAYRRDFILALPRSPGALNGPYDEGLLTNEDYELNTRVRQGGGKLWLDPAIRSVYFARPTLRQLAQQYWRYGYWKVRMLRRYPKTLRLRQALPPALVLALLGSALLALLVPWGGWLLLGLAAVYALFLLAAGAQAAVKARQWHLLLGTPLAIGVMQLTWGSAFLFSLLEGLFKR